MPGGITEYGAQLALDLLHGGATMPSTLFLALTRTEPDDESTGETIDEPSGNGYARVSFNNATFWHTAENAQKQNAASIEFPQATGRWGTVRYAVVCDAATEGNVISWASLGMGRSIHEGGTAWIAERGLTFGLASEE